MSVHASIMADGRGTGREGLTRLGRVVAEQLCQLGAVGAVLVHSQLQILAKGLHENTTTVVSRTAKISLNILSMQLADTLKSASPNPTQGRGECVLPRTPSQV
jgi:hypothetical protein